MKKIEIIIRQGKLDNLKEALFQAGIRGMTVSNILGCGNQKGYTQIYRGNKIETRLLPKTKIEIAVRDEIVDDLIKVIIDVTRTGEVGDGKIFVSDLETAVRIRTGETGENAL
jgi:nitrogen regulatory protein P-II 1